MGRSRILRRFEEADDSPEDNAAVVVIGVGALVVVVAGVVVGVATLGTLDVKIGVEPYIDWLYPLTASINCKVGFDN